MIDFSDPSHLPNLRKGQSLEPDWLPRQRRGITPQLVGRYPDFNVLENCDNWDEATRKTVFARLEVGTDLSFFSAAQAPAARALCDIVTAQDREPRVPVVELVDAKLAVNEHDGYQYSDMPDDEEAWRLVLEGLDYSARAAYQLGFANCERPSQEFLVTRFSKGDLSGGPWNQLNVKRAWSVCTRMILAAFYSHPWAWNEIGFGGPAYPRGFMRLGGLGVREPFEQPAATSEDPVKVVKDNARPS